MSAIERHRDVIVRWLRRSEIALRRTAMHPFAFDVPRVPEMLRQADELSEVIAELERESTRAGGGT